ncbi:MAG: NUMOD3 domain-containing DNA-binding protein [Fluviibacter sp.]
MAYVYRHIRLDKNVPFYIGIGSDHKYKRAYSSHNRNHHWKNITRKTDYKVQIVLDDLTWEEACKKEKELIALYKRNYENGLLCNLTAGGEGNTNPAPETRYKISISQKGESNNMFGKPKSENWYKSIENFKGQGNPNYGKQISEEQKALLRKAHLGRKRDPEIVAKIVAANKGRIRSEESRKRISEGVRVQVIDTCTGVIYNTITAAAKANGYNRRTLTAWLSGHLINKSTLTYYKNESI